jgi:hypothetical protein
MLSIPTLPAVSASNSSLVLPVVSAKTSMPFTILKTLHERVKNLPKSVPMARKTNPLAGYGCDPKELTSNIAADINVWETWDQRLNVLIPHSIPNVYSLVRQGKYSGSKNHPNVWPLWKDWPAINHIK